MTHQNDDYLSGILFEELTQNRLGALPELVKVLVNKDSFRV